MYIIVFFPTEMYIEYALYLYQKVDAYKMVKGAGTKIHKYLVGLLFFF